MGVEHSRFFQLCEKFGSPIGMVAIQKELNLISSTSAKIEFVSEVEVTKGKKLSRKLLLTMTVAQLKAMIAHLFKVEVMN
jgi:hypothetical protein